MSTRKNHLKRKKIMKNLNGKNDLENKNERKK
jgi:hypothetical protein